jgi:spore germination cell wall hydrolase CwlJ-like protein
MLRRLKFWIVLLAFYPALGFAQPSELDCLTANVYFESRGESLAGKRAVADVTINRTKHSVFKGQDTICKVVFAPYQFSWVNSQPKRRVHGLLNGYTGGLKDKDLVAYHLAKEVAIGALSEGYKPLLPPSVVSFHSVGILPQWAYKMKKYTRIGGHVFYGFKRKDIK